MPAGLFPNITWDQDIPTDPGCQLDTGAFPGWRACCMASSHIRAAGFEAKGSVLSSSTGVAT